MGNLDKIFDSVSKRSLFKNKQILQANYSPDDIPHRDKEIEHIASILAPSLLGEKTSNLFIYGKTGTGKTLSVQHVANELTRRTKDSNICNELSLLIFISSICSRRRERRRLPRALVSLSSEMWSEELAA